MKPEPKFKVGQRVERLRAENPPMPVSPTGEIIHIEVPTDPVYGTIEEVMEGSYMGHIKLSDDYFYIFRPDGVKGKMPPECMAHYHEGCFKAVEKLSLGKRIKDIFIRS